MRKFSLILTLILTSTLSFAMENKKADTQTKVKLTTSMGDIVIQVKGKSAPISSENFLTYVKEGFYDGTVFHRIIPDFMAQGGGFDSDMKQKKVRAAIKNEANNGVKNTRGTLAMARTSDPDSATAQFFINYKDNSFLDYTSSTAQGWGYAVFAEVIEGMDVVDKMAKAPTATRGGHQDVPKENIVIKKAEIIK